MHISINLNFARHIYLKSCEQCKKKIDRNIYFFAHTQSHFKFSNHLRLILSRCIALSH